MRKGKWPTTFMSCVLNEEGLQKRLISHSNLKIRRLSNSVVSQEQRRRRERGTYHFRTLEVLQGSPEVADCLVPQHPLVPDLQQKPGVEAVELTEKTITRRFLNKIEIQRYVIYSQQKVLFPRRLGTLDRDRRRFDIFQLERNVDATLRLRTDQLCSPN